jgi:hypothetical protein
VIDRIRHPRTTASSNRPRVSEVSPEYDDAIRSVCGPQNSGSSGVRNDRDRDAQAGRGDGREHVSRDGRAPHAAHRDGRDAVGLGERVRGEPGRVGLSTLRGKARHHAEHPARIRGPQGRPVVEVGHRFFLAEAFERWPASPPRRST